jgi:hypothetical protein
MVLDIIINLIRKRKTIGILGSPLINTIDGIRIVDTNADITPTTFVITLGRNNYLMCNGRVRTLTNKTSLQDRKEMFLHKFLLHRASATWASISEMGCET